MAVVIRMKRTGRRNRPCYRISVCDSRSPRDGRTLETIGLYDPISPDPERREIVKVERAKAWLAKGALPSETVRSILKRAGALEGLPPKKKRDRTGRKKATATRARRMAQKAARAEAKAKRRQERVAARRLARAAAAPEGEGES